MQHLDRPGTPPDILRSPAAQRARRDLLEFWGLERRRRAQTSPPISELPSDEPSLVRAVAEFSHGRCAFCEAEAKLFAHRFRPSANALPLANSSDAHLYYSWLADAWQNFLPICSGCIPSEPQFPVARGRMPLPSIVEIGNYVERGDGIWPFDLPNESRQLLDPTIDTKFEKHLLPTLDGELIGLSAEGRHTISVFDLNRPERRQRREYTYHRYIEALRSLPILEEGADSLAEEWVNIFDFSKAEYGGTWYLLLRRIAQWINQSRNQRFSITPKEIRRFFERAVLTPEPTDSIARALAALRRDDRNRSTNVTGVGSAVALRSPVKSIQISDFKSIESLTLEFPFALDEPKPTQAPSLVILGENATGKSSILEAVALTLTTVAARDRLDLDWHSIALDPLQLGADGAEQKVSSRPQVEIALSSDASFILEIGDGVPTVKTAVGARQVPIFAYGAFRRFTKRTRRPAADRHIHNLFDGEALANPEPWLKKLHPDQFDMVIRSLRDLLSVEGDFEVIEFDSHTKDLRVKTAVGDPDGTKSFIRTPLHAVSSGYRSMLGMLCDVMRGLLDPEVYEGFETFQTARGVVLIDEIEAHLHPRWKMQVMSSLRSALPGMTFIVTTHDPLCLRGMETSEVVVLQRVATADSEIDSSMPTVVERVRNLPPVKELRLEQLLTSDFFHMFSTDDAVADRQLAHIADLIARRARTNDLNQTEIRVLRRFEEDIANALPIGSSEVHRIVQNAVAEYLARRRDASSKTLQDLRSKAKDEILAALEGI
ncbi:AAA family ATPase [Rhizobium laguerreae]|nr:AAA family ATPase [Rhizobium laguerreae]